MAEYKNKRCKFLIVMGCLVQRYYDDLAKALPEVDLFLKIEDYDKMWEKTAKPSLMPLAARAIVLIAVPPLKHLRSST